MAKTKLAPEPKQTIVPHALGFETGKYYILEVCSRYTPLDEIDNIRAFFESAGIYVLVVSTLNGNSVRAIGTELPEEIEIDGIRFPAEQRVKL